MSLLEDSRTQYSEGEVVYPEGSERGEVDFNRSSHFNSEGELSLHESEGEI